MALQFNKTKVVERLTKHLEQAVDEEGPAREAHQRKVEEWREAVEDWREAAIDFYTEYVNAQENDEAVSVNIYAVPKIPDKPTQRALTESTSIRHYIGQVECLEGDVITLSKGLLDGVGRYLGD